VSNLHCIVPLSVCICIARGAFFCLLSVSSLEACSLQLCKHAGFIKEIIGVTLYEAPHFSFTNPAANHSHVRLDVEVCHSAPLPCENSSRFHFILNSCFAACKNWWDARKASTRIIADFARNRILKFRMYIRWAKVAFRATTQ
jgi:hypothetical protein